MKRIASLVGVGAMVLTFGLGQALAQTAATPAPGAPSTKQTAPADLGKDKAAKPGAEVKPEKTADKAALDKAAPAAKPEKTVHGAKKVVHKKHVRHHGTHVKHLKASTAQKGVKAEEPKPAAKQ